MSDHRVVAAGESVLVVELEDRIDPAVNARVIAVAEAVQASRIGGVRDIVPTYRSLAIYFDPLRTDYDELRARLDAAASEPVPPASAAPDPIRVPVLYGGEEGPDLAAVAAHSQLSEAEVVRLHAGRVYRVFMLGFVAGFAYMGILDSRIAVPRQTTPRLKVPVGSVAIAGVQTGIYPAETPGGWQVIGRTPLRPFDPMRADPFLLKAGAAVQFLPVDRAEYERLTAG
ncbi:MAG TPA: 5-oxoprolinase subunit PxpB [Vicinamibacterales bacterium]|jgi:inhibitor of KinA|nr:5-oxoprolinase subunit PxpB [Vicinamibacterales bacterium]